MKRLISLENSYRVETFGLSEEQHGIAVGMATCNKMREGSYSLCEVDGETVKFWLDIAKEEDSEYSEFLKDALSEYAEVYTLKDSLGGFCQPLGEVAVYDVGHDKKIC